MSALSFLQSLTGKSRVDRRFRKTELTHMMKQQQRTKVAPIVLAVLAAITTAVAGPYEIRRCVDDPSAVRSVAVLAMTSSAPFDDEVGVLSDGAAYFYVVNDTAGDPRQLSVHKNPLLDTVRLGFDDGDPSSADVHPALSSVTVSPATIPADGMTWATIVVVPRDGSGIPLGSGLDLTIDTDLLYPGLAASPIVDRGNGTYSVSVISWSEGFGEAVVVVEGVMLADTPELTYTYAEGGPHGLPRDLLLIALELDTIADSGPDSVSEPLDEGIKDVYRAVNALYESPTDFDSAIFWIGKVLLDLENAADAGMGSSLVEEYQERLADIARRIAQETIQLAVVSGGKATKLEDAHNNFASANYRLSQPDFVGAVADFMNAAKDARVSISNL